MQQQLSDEHVTTGGQIKATIKYLID